MRRIPAFVVVAALVASMPVSGFAGETGTTPDTRLAMSLEEMNCASSDVQAREAPRSPEQAIDPDQTRLADSSSGTNGIPCPPRDPKTPPAQRS